MRITVQLKPRGGRDAVDGWAQDDEGRRVLRVRVAAPPADGAANKSLCRLLARTYGVPPSAVRIVSGATARTKLLEIDGVSSPDGLDNA